MLRRTCSVASARDRHRPASPPRRPRQLRQHHARPAHLRVQPAADRQQASRTASPSSRRRFIRESSWLSGSFAGASVLDLRRLLVGRPTVSISLCMRFSCQPAGDELASPASRAIPGASAARRGGRSRSAVATMPRPKWCCQSRLTITRAVSGLSGRRDPLRQRQPPAGAVGSVAIAAATGLPPGETIAGKPGCTSAPVLASSPRSSRNVFGGGPGRVGQAHRHRQRRRLLARRTPSAPSAAASSFARSSAVSALAISASVTRDLRLGLGDEFLLPAGRASPAACGGRPAPPARASRASPRTASCGAAPPSRRSRRGSASSASRYSRLRRVRGPSLRRRWRRAGRGGTRPA